MTEAAQRYLGHISLPGMGVEGQRRLMDAHVAVAGCGGLGSAMLPWLAAAGIGRFTLIDGDTVEPSNLQRQLIHTVADIGRPKAESAAEEIHRLNPEARVEIVNEFLTAENAARLLAGAGIIADCTDSLASKTTVARAAVEMGLPCAMAAVMRFGAQLTTCLPGAPCYGCLYGDAGADAGSSCALEGIFNGVVGVAGTLQACEVMKVITGIGEPLSGRLLTVDTLTMAFSEVAFAADPACPICGNPDFIK